MIIANIKLLYLFFYLINIRISIAKFLKSFSINNLESTKIKNYYKDYIYYFRYRKDIITIYIFLDIIMKT